MAKSKSPVPLDKWYSFAADSRTRAFLTPHVPRLRIVTDPEDVTIVTRFTTYVQSGGDSRLSVPTEEPACYSIGMRRSDGSTLQLREGTILQFTEEVLARLDSLNSPYWRKLKTPLISAGPNPDSSNVLLCYINLTFLSPDQIKPHEQSHIQRLTPADTLFD
ncbi:hypothetical protein GCM10022408_37970 [Hymenobacter fastidiosus]|uniref:AraC family transcriptional regulator n=1 Tax=Hymenobacter fastidiosus TaxID=486264 RepID=A0ABP7T314_9BACT